MLGIDYAKKFLKYQEVRDNKALREAFRKYAINGDLNINPAETAWCSAFMNMCERAVGNKTAGLLNARSWLTYGSKIESIKQAKRGDLLIFSRGGSTWQGHITYFDGIEDDGLIRCLGGNQNDSVCYSIYPVSRLLGVRRNL